MNKSSKYNEASIKSLNWKQHIRKRPGMYIGKLGDGSSVDDGIYILFEFMYYLLCLYVGPKSPVVV